MTAETKRFLAVRFVVMVAWAALIVGAFALSVVIGDRVDHDVVRWLVSTAALLGSVRLGLVLQSRVLSRVDPDGRLRAAVAALGADAEDH